MTHIPVGTKIPITEFIPLPLPRLVMEEVVTGGKLNPLDIPLPDMADIDLSYPLVGLDWLLYPWTVLKRETMNLWNTINIYDFAEHVHDLFIYGMALFVLVTAIVFASLGLGWLGRKIWK